MDEEEVALLAGNRIYQRFPALSFPWGLLGISGHLVHPSWQL